MLFTLRKLLALLPCFVPSVTNALPGTSDFLAAQYAPRELDSAHNANASTLGKRATGSLVFCHFIVGIVSNRQSSTDYDADMQRAKIYGIDAFALNIGKDDYTDKQLGFAYTSAKNNGMKVFLSFDMTYWATTDTQGIGQKIAQYATGDYIAAQLMVENKVFASTFNGDDPSKPPILNVGDVKSQAKTAGLTTELYFAPNFHPWQHDFSDVDGALNWSGWPSDGNNKAPKPGTAGVSVDQGDDLYRNALSASQGYIAPAAAWFFTHFSTEAPKYSKNWLFPCELLWYERWTQILKLKPAFVEILTWNDYGESHYIGPLSSPHGDDGSSKWVNDMPHDGWLDMAKPFIAAYKNGEDSVNSHIESDQIIYWYRPQMKSVNCDSTDSCMTPIADNPNYFVGRPDGYTTVSDNVFVVALLTSDATLTVISGTNSQDFKAPAGPTAVSVPMGVGKQTFTITRGSQTISGTSSKDIIDGCVCGLYNFNAYVGIVPALANDQLAGAAFESFSAGLRVSTCAAQPSGGTGTGTSGGNTPSPTTSMPVTSPSTTTGYSLTTTSLGTTAATSPPVVSSSYVSAPSPTYTSTGTGGTTYCISGYGPDNYMGLCDFACQYAYCPGSSPDLPGPCNCAISSTVAKPTPAICSTEGYPRADLPNYDSYLGLCSFACAHGYCPDTACVAA